MLTHHLVIVGGIIPLRRATSSRYDGRLEQESAVGNATTLASSISGAKAFTTSIAIGGATIGSDALAVAGTATISSYVKTNGLTSHAGTGGSYGANHLHLQFTNPGVHLWVDNSDQGLITVTSDRRLKHDIKPLSGSALSRAMQMRPVSFVFNGQADVTEGFVADELQMVVPSAVNGQRDALTSDGKIQPQSLNLAPAVAVLAKGLQEAYAELKADNENMKDCMKSWKCRLFGQ